MRGLVRRIVMPAVVAAVVMGGLVGTAGSATAADGDKPQPGLPFLSCPLESPLPSMNGPDLVTGCPDGTTTSNFFSWYNTSQIGLTGSVKAQQWSRVPLTMLATNALFYYISHPFGRRVPIGEKSGTEFSYLVRAFFISPEGSDDDYGLSAPITVRALAFGAIPAEVTLQVAQSMDDDGLPEPITVVPHDYRVKVGNPDERRAYSDAASIETDVNIRVLSVKVDGVDSGLEDGCQTGPTARLRASSEAFDALEADGGLEAAVDPKKNQLYGVAGGGLTGSIDIPAFSGCSTVLGDDLSPLLTSALSADGNPLDIRIGALACNIFDETGLLPAAPGTNDPRDPAANCVPAGVANPAYAVNPNIVTIPEQFRLPDKAVEPVTDGQ